MLANSLGTDMRVWDLLLPHLPDGLRIVRFDKRGHGQSDCPDAPYRIEELIADAETIAEALALSQITFVGLSIGGLIGQGLAAKRPDLLRALVLMDTAAKVGSEQTWEVRMQEVRAQGLAAMADGIFERWFGVDFRADPARLTPWREMLTSTPLEGYIGCCAAIAGSDFTQSTAALTLPVMALVGSDDLATPPELVQATAQLCGATFSEISGAGHLPCVDRPEATAKLIRAFLQKTA
jgi:3-oxoadipate enol-lactonase